MVLALAWTIGLHWALLQSVAWTGMVIAYAQDAGLKEALVRTFDGKHPCPLCKEIAKGKQSEKKSDFQPEMKKFEFSHATTSFVFSPPQYFWTVRSRDGFGSARSHEPPVPPPRQLPA
jgi:hypothetical protein